MRGKLLGFALALVSIATIGMVQLGAEAYVDTTRDCDKYAVIYCGTMSVAEAHNKYDQGAKIFSAMGIKKSEISGTFKKGVVYQNGNVTVGGKVVAKNAHTAIRNFSGGNKIAGTNAAIYPTSRMGSAQEALVKFDKFGRFLFAIMTPCGNPVTGNPTQPKPVAKCDNLKVTSLSRTKFRFNANATAKYGAKVNSYTYTVTKGGNTVLNKTVNSSEYTYVAQDSGSYKVRVKINTNIGNGITSSDCVKTFSVANPPAASCKSLTVNKINRTTFNFKAEATATGGAKVSKYIFQVYEAGSTTAIHTKEVATANLSASYQYQQSTVGDYSVRVKVVTTEGEKTNANCVKPFTVEEEKVPGVKIDKKVNNKELEQVAVGEPFIYTLVVTNTGNTVLKNVVVTDEAPEHVEFISTDKGTIVNNSLNYTISQLAIGGTDTINITAKAVSEAADGAVNEACVDAPEVPGQPDDCDTATIEVPIEVCDLTTNQIITIDQEDFDETKHSRNLADCENVQVCDPETGEIITVPKHQEDDYLPVDSDECKDKIQVCDLTTNTVITILEEDFDETKHSRNLADCENVQVCDPETGEIITVPKHQEDDYLPVDSDECKDDVTVCDPETGNIITVPAKDEDKYLPVDSDECKEAPVTPDTPPELPRTGPAEAVMQIIGAMSLVGASSYYVTSRRQ